MSSFDPSPCVAVCRGKHCRNRDERADLLEALEGRAEVVPTRCLGICSGPVVVVERPERRPVVLRKIRSGKARRDLLRVLDGEDLTDRLKRRRAKGKEKRKARARAGVD